MRVLPTLILAAGLSGCTEANPVGGVPLVVADPVLQAAYENCVRQRGAALPGAAERDRGPDSLPPLLSGVYRSCETAVVHTCVDDRETETCQRALRDYG